MVSEITKNILARAEYISYDFEFHKTVKIEKLGIELNGYLIVPKRANTYEHEWNQNILNLNISYFLKLI